MRHIRLTAADVVALVQFYFVLAATAFLILAWTGNYPMSPDVYGHAVDAIPAWSWASFLFVTHGSAALGSWLGRPFMTMLGAGIAVFAYIAFSVLATSARFGDLVVIFSAFVNAPIHITIAIYAAGRWADGRE